MAIDDKFYFHAGSDDRETIGQLIGSGLERGFETYHWENRYKGYNDFLSVDISKADRDLDRRYFDEINKEHDIEGYQFSASHHLYFSWRKRDIQQYAYDRTKIINLMLNSYDGDAIFLAGTENPRLWRRNGQLFLSTREDNSWFTAYDEPLANLITLPYEMEEMTFAV